MPVSQNKSKTQKPKTGFCIGVTCPGCGGELELEDDLAILICNHCGSVLRVVYPDIPPAYMVPSRQSPNEIRFAIDRYLKTQGLPLTRAGLEFKYLYYPYWKTDAVVLKLRNKVEERLIASETSESPERSIKQERTEISLVPHHQTSRAGHQMAGIPDSIGLRAEYIKMLPFSESNVPEDYVSLPVVRPWDDAWESCRKSVSSYGRMAVADFGKNRTELMYPVKSLVFFPYVIVESYEEERFLRFCVDGSTGRILDFVDRPPALDNEDTFGEVCVEFGSLDVTFHRCVNCGFDLPPVKSYVSVCDNCHQVDLLEAGSLAAEDLMVAEIPEQNKAMFYPFWSFKMPEGEAAEIKRLFGGIYDSDWLSIPAFRISNFEALYRLSKRVTSAVPQINMIPLEEHDNRYLPVTLSAEEARRLTGVIIHRRRIKNDPEADRADIDFKPSSLRLLYIPFHPEHYFCVDSILGAVTFEKALVV